jgi:hypothetical protein
MAVLLVHDHHGLVVLGGLDVLGVRFLAHERLVRGGDRIGS